MHNDLRTGPMSHLARCLQTMAFHLTELWDMPGGRTFEAGLHHGDLLVMVKVEITAVAPGGADRIWDQHVVNGRHEGNRCGARDAVARLYAPVIAAAAAEDARIATQVAA